MTGLDAACTPAQATVRHPPAIICDGSVSMQSTFVMSS
jgi:hypothetical protein